eukprot:7921209-Ditylum_brightwellii.AAC.2
MATLGAGCTIGRSNVTTLGAGCTLCVTVQLVLLGSPAKVQPFVPGFLLMEHVIKAYVLEE